MSGRSLFSKRVTESGPLGQAGEQVRHGDRREM
jgi:hypothetical protein